MISVFPFYYAIITSFKTGTALFEVDYFPTSARLLSNYVDVLSNPNFLRSSLELRVHRRQPRLALPCFSRSQPLTRWHVYIFKRSRVCLLMCILAVSMFPQIAVLAGLFELVRALGIYNTPWAMILSYTIFTLPFIVWVLTTFMRDLPVEIEEAAIIDGATPWVIISQVFLPLMWPALVTTGLLAFIGAWNEFLVCSDLHRIRKHNAPCRSPSRCSLAASEFEIPWGALMAASVIVTVPLIALVLIFQRKIVAGLTAGGVKG